MRGKALAAILAAGCAGAHAANWIEATNSSKLTAYVDFTSVKRVGSDSQMWVKMVPKTPGVIAKKSFDYAVELDRFNCEDETLQTQQSAYYKNDGTFVYSFTDALDKSVPVPGTIGAGILRTGCMAIAAKSGVDLEKWIKAHPSDD